MQDCFKRAPLLFTNTAPVTNSRQPSLKVCMTFKDGVGTHCRMNCTASSYFIPLSMRAKATKTGALREKEIQRSGSKRQSREKEGRRTGD